MALILLICGFFAYVKAFKYCTENSEYRTYGIESKCDAFVYICYHDEYFQSSWWDGHVELEGFRAPKTDHKSKKSDTRTNAVWSFFDKYHYNTSCNRITEQVKVNNCEINIETCWYFYVMDDVDLNKVYYESWATSGSFITGHYCCDYQKNKTINMAVQDLMHKDPSCFTLNPTTDPTTDPSKTPTLNPHSDPTSAPTKNPIIDCNNCILLEGLQCKDGYQPYIANNNYCELCPDGKAGHDGTCYDCNNGQRPTWDHKGCEQIPTSNSGWTKDDTKWLIGLLVGILGGSISSGLLVYCLKKHGKCNCCSNVSTNRGNSVNDESDDERKDDKNDEEHPSVPMIQRDQLTQSIIA